MKKTLVFLLVFMLVGCSHPQETETNHPVDENPASNELNVSMDLEIIPEFGDVKYMFDTSKAVVLASFDSIDGADTYSNLKQQYCSAYSYGNLTIQHVYKGDLTEGEQIKYYKAGGKVTFDQYYATLSEPQRDKFDSTFTGQAKPEFINIQFSEDIQPVLGKTYLVYLIDDTRINGDGYLIYGFGAGLREVEPSRQQSFMDGGFKVKNNATSEWENIDDVIGG